MTKDWKENPDLRDPRRIPDDEFHRRLRATEALMEKISVEKGPHREENIKLGAFRTAIWMRGYMKRSLVLQIRRGARPKLIPAPQSSVGVLRRMRRAVEQDNNYNFVRAIRELPEHLQRRLGVIARDGEESAGFLDPWMMLFIMGPAPEYYGTSLPAKADILSALDTVIAEVKKPGRRQDSDRRDLVVQLILRWARFTKTDLREPRYETGTSRRTGPLAEYIRELETIWNVQLVSTNSGASMRKAILDARRE
jgi:hypothetical protein